MRIWGEGEPRAWVYYYGAGSNAEGAGGLVLT